MITRPGELLPLAVQALTQPRASLRRILDTPVSRQVLYLCAAILIVLNLLAAVASEIIIGVPPGGGVSLFASAIVAIAVIGICTLFLVVAGRIFDGRGSIDDCFKTVLWFNFIVFLLQLLVPIFSLIAPQTVGLVFLLIVILTLVQMTAQVMEVHGFTRIMPVVLGIIGTQFIFGIVLLVLLTMLGVPLPIDPAATNV